MGFFSSLRKRKEDNRIYAPVTGNYICLKDIPDKVFASGMLGDGCGVEPSEGVVYSPVTGVVVMVAETKHAVGIRTETGRELLIHIGMDTVRLNGTGFQVKVKQGQQVEHGTVLMTFDMEQIRQAGYSLTSALILSGGEATDGKLRIDQTGACEAGTVIGMLE